MGFHPDITFFELQLFSEVARHSSLRAVARQRGLTPGHVSKTLKRLEKKLGVSLFRRSSTGVVLSPEGQRLVPSIDTVLRSAEALGVDEQSSEGHAKVLVGIGSVSFLNSQLIPEVIASLRAGFSDLRFRLVDVAPDGIVAAGLRGAFEAAVHVGPLPWTKAWSSARAGELKWGLIARADHSLGRTVSQKDLALHSFVVPSYWSSEGFLPGNDFCPMPWRDRQFGDEVSSAPAAVEVVRATEQIAFVPLVAARRSLDSGDVREIRVREWKRPVQKSLYLSVRSDAVSQQLFRALQKAIACF